MGTRTKGQTLRVLGTTATLLEPLRRRAIRDLGFDIRFEVEDGQACQRRAIMRPDSFDIYDQWFHSVDLLWTASTIQPIATDRITRWPQVRLPADAAGGQRRAAGRRPSEVMFVQGDDTLGAGSTGRIAMLPTAYNVDSFAYVRDRVPKALRGAPESWSWLLDEHWRGRCTMSQDPAPSAVELALAAVSSGAMEIADLGDLTIEEIDRLIDLLMGRKRRGHFARFWDSSEESVRLMIGPGCSLGALWSPAYYALRATGRDIAYAMPREGYRGWQAGLSLSAALPAEKDEMAYAFLNWWLDGAPGAVMARQGYYMSVVEPLRTTLSAAEWDYWYAGLPAACDLAGVDGSTVVRAGERREGGSYAERSTRVAVWSTIMSEHNYLARRWREFQEA